MWPPAKEENKASVGDNTDERVATTKEVNEASSDNRDSYTRRWSLEATSLYGGDEGGADSDSGDILCDGSSDVSSGLDRAIHVRREVHPLSLDSQPS